MRLGRSSFFSSLSPSLALFSPESEAARWFRGRCKTATIPSNHRKLTFNIYSKLHYMRALCVLSLELCCAEGRTIFLLLCCIMLLRRYYDVTKISSGKFHNNRGKRKNTPQNPVCIPADITDKLVPSHFHASREKRQKFRIYGTLL